MVIFSRFSFVIFQLFTIFVANLRIKIQINNSSPMFIFNIYDF
nr:MAG TPA: hypothetical protein [Caudoviricetes sp.]